MWRLSINTHSGKRITTQGWLGGLTRRATGKRYPITTSHFGSSPARLPAVVAASVKTAAIRVAKSPEKTALRVANVFTESVGTASPGGASCRSAVRAAAAANRDATNSRPDPRNTVANSRSSAAPNRVRRTPRNHRKAIPANGTRYRAISMDFRLDCESSQVAGSPLCARAADLARMITAARMRANAMPATAAARGVRNSAGPAMESSMP